MARNLLYISTNEMWSGSEELWYASALKFLEKGVCVSVMVSYEHPKIEALKSRLTHFLYIPKDYKTPTFSERIVNRLTKSFQKRETLSEKIIRTSADLVVISQGSNTTSADIMELCSDINIPYVTVTQLVAEVHALTLSERHYERLKSCYNKAVNNYFVSQSNLNLHKFLLGINALNNEVVFNPNILDKNRIISYPHSDTTYRVAFVGRIDSYHKGLDILLQTLNQEKWKVRPIVFNLYGSGPQVAIIKDILKVYDIPNVFLIGFASDVKDVWENNQILILPSRMEGQALALIEALFCNRSAIVTNVGGAAEVIEDNITGFIANSATVKDLDDAMERAWEQRDRWEEIGKAAGKRINELMPEDAVDYFNSKLKDVLRELYHTA